MELAQQAHVTLTALRASVTTGGGGGGAGGNNNVNSNKHGVGSQR